MSNQANNAFRRILLGKTKDDGDVQMLTGDGFFGEVFGGSLGIPRIQEYGLTSFLPPDTHGGGHAQNGNPDQMRLSGFENGKLRPKNLQEGELKGYDKWSHYIHKKADEWLTKVGTAVMQVADSGTIHLNPPSAMLMAMGLVLRDGERHPLTDPRPGAHKHHFTFQQFETLQRQEIEAQAVRERVIAEAQAAYEVRHAEEQRPLLDRIAALEARLMALEAQVNQTGDTNARDPKVHQ